MKKPTNIFDEGYVFKEPIDAFNESMRKYTDKELIRKYTDKELRKRAFKSFMKCNLYSNCDCWSYVRCI